MLGSNPDPLYIDGWSLKTGRAFDVARDVAEYEPEMGYSLSCHWDRVGPGTVGWVHRSNRADGHMVAVIVFSGRIDEIDETSPKTGIVTPVKYGVGALRRLAEPDWIPGRRISSDPRWSGRAPYCDPRRRRFQNGMSVLPGEAALLLDLLPVDVRTWLDSEIDRAC
jgi:hypothetical protein